MMALLPAPPQRHAIPARFAGTGPPEPVRRVRDLYQRMGQLISGASGGGWQPPARSRALLAGRSETGQDWLAEAGQPRRIQVTAG